METQGADRRGHAEAFCELQVRVDGMLKVAIVGCGKVADSHVRQIQSIAECEIVGVCDREPLMARQLAERFQVKRCFAEVRELISEARPDVIHITTPPASHLEIAKYCLEQGCHVYVEKPFTLYAHEAEQIINLADQKDLHVTAGHNYQFTPVARRMREMVKSGYLGGPPLHMEGYYCYDVRHSYYARAVLGDKDHWVRKLPGKLLHNIISHGIARIAEYVADHSPQVTACGFPSAYLKSLDETEIVDELRVIVNDQERATAYFTFSSQMKPAINQFRIFGPWNGLLLDQDQDLLLCLNAQKVTTKADLRTLSALFIKQRLRELPGELRGFMPQDQTMESGMRLLIEAFYRSIVKAPPRPFLLVKFC